RTGARRYQHRRRSGVRGARPRASPRRGTEARWLPSDRRAGAAAQGSTCLLRAPADGRLELRGCLMSRMWLVLLPSVVILAWLTASSTSIRVASRIWMRDWVEHGGRGAEAFRGYLERPQRLLSVAAAAAGLTLLATGAALDAAYDEVARDYIIAMVVTTIVLAVLGQALPRALARRWPTRLAPMLVPPLRILALAVVPLERLGSALLPASWRRPQVNDPFQELLREGLVEGVGSREEIATIATIVQFAEKRVGQVMTPRHEIFAIDESLETELLAHRIAQSKYSRVPILRGSLD